MEKNMADLAREALNLQNACNTTAVFLAGHRILAQMSRMGMSTNELSEHSITRVIVDKLISLTGTATVDDWDRVHEIAEGRNVFLAMEESGAVDKDI